MRILSSSMNSASTSPSCSSPHSSICTQSLSSYANSIPSSKPNSSYSSTDFTTRCQGLDLLVKAVHYVAGSMVGVPFTQRRVIRRRKRRSLMFSKFIISEILNKEEEEEEKKKDKEVEANSKAKRQRRVMALPLKYQDSVLQSWKRQSRRRQSIHIGDGSG